MKAKDLSTKAQQCFEYLQADPGDQPLADCLMTILRQLPQVSPWLRLDKLVSIYQLGYGAKLDAQLDRYRRLDSWKPSSSSTTCTSTRTRRIRRKRFTGTSTVLGQSS